VEGKRDHMVTVKRGGKFKISRDVTPHKKGECQEGGKVGVREVPPPSAQYGGQG